MNDRITNPESDVIPLEDALAMVHPRDQVSRFADLICRYPRECASLPVRRATVHVRVDVYQHPGRLLAQEKEQRQPTESEHEK